jgi:hypothetical protein
VSQLKVDFATITACIPTVLRLIEEIWRKSPRHVLGQTAIYSTERTGDTNDRTRANIHLGGLKFIDRGHQPTRPYTPFDKDDGWIDGELSKRRKPFIYIEALDYGKH